MPPAGYTNSAARPQQGGTLSAAEKRKLLWGNKKAEAEAEVL